MCQAQLYQRETAAHDCSERLSERLRAKDRENAELKEVLGRVNNKLEVVFKAYYP